MPIITSNGSAQSHHWYNGCTADTRGKKSKLTGDELFKKKTKKREKESLEENVKARYFLIVIEFFCMPVLCQEFIYLISRIL